MKHIKPMSVVDASNAGPGADLVFRILGAVEGYKGANKFNTVTGYSPLAFDLFYQYYDGGGNN